MPIRSSSGTWACMHFNKLVQFGGCGCVVWCGDLPGMIALVQSLLFRQNSLRHYQLFVRITYYSTVEARINWINRVLRRALQLMTTSVLLFYNIVIRFRRRRHSIYSMAIRNDWELIARLLYTECSFGPHDAILHHGRQLNTLFLQTRNQ